ncbi:MAG: HIT family protein [Nanobdellota archaeon]
MLSDDQKKALEEQKKNCPFCKIIKGEIPAKIIFKNDQTRAILDINPTAEGHALVMPKEHYPILPLLSEEEFQDLFSVSVKIADIEKVLFLKQGSTIFVANGGAAGQQSSHFMVHVIARNPEEVTKLNIKEKDLDKEKVEDLRSKLSNNLSIMLKDDYSRYPIKDDEGNEVPLKQKFTKDQVIGIIEKNPQLKDALVKEPSEFKKAVPQNEQLKSMFEQVDIDEVIRHFVPDYQGGEEESSGEEKEKSIEDETRDEGASEKSHEEILDFIEKNPRLKGFILDDPESFKKQLPESEKLKGLFEGTDPDRIIAELKEREKTEGSDEEEKEEEGSDLDKVSKLFGKEGDG